MSIVFLGSSVVEQLAVNQWVGGSSPSRGAINWTSIRCPNDKLAHTQSIHNIKMKEKKEQKTSLYWWRLLLLKCTFTKKIIQNSQKTPKNCEK